MSDAPDPFTAEDYFSLLLRRAQRAEREGNYAISAAAVARHGGLEIVALGANSLFAEQNPIGHAEVNAIMTLRAIATATPDRLEKTLTVGEADGSIVIRPAPSDRSEAILYTTLEPCPMCTVCTINSGIDRVVIAAEDPPSGSFAPERLGALPQLWPELAKEIEIVWAQSDDASSGDSYVPAELREELIGTFLNSRERLDSRLSRHGTLDLPALGAAVLAVRGGALAPSAGSVLSPSS
jgi:tRNA(Arg) A34 adenosine deaminase TadA